MKKLLFAAAVMAVGLGAVSCNSDDDNSAVDPLVGTWKAETVSYTFNGETHTYPYNVEGGPFGGCEVDFLTLKEDHTVLLLEHIKDDNDVCNDVESPGNWTETVVHVKDVDREIKSISGNDLVLSYPLVFYGQTLPITVTYSRQ